MSRAGVAARRPTRGVHPAVHTPTPTDDPDAAIAVEKINGPVLTLCGEADQLWDSCRYSDAIQQRLAQHQTPFPRAALSYPDADHAIDFSIPGSAAAPASPAQAR